MSNEPTIAPEAEEKEEEAGPVRVRYTGFSGQSIVFVEGLWGSGGHRYVDEDQPVITVPAEVAEVLLARGDFELAGPEEPNPQQVSESGSSSIRPGDLEGPAEPAPATSRSRSTRK